MISKKIPSLLAATLAVSLIFAGCTKSTPVSSSVPEGAASETAASSEISEPAQAIENGASEAAASVTYPITITHAFGETVIESKPERIAAISWGNQDLPLALGIVPVGISTANYGVQDDSGLLPWTAAGFDALGAENPVLFDDVAGLDFEAINDTQPDVILAAYSGITQEEYDLLSQIAPVVAYPQMPWQTFWRDQILLNATGMGLQPEGEALVRELETLISDKTAQYPQLAGKTAAFFYFSPTDLGKFYVYLPEDPRAAYLTDLGMAFPESVLKLAEGSDSFALEMSAENVDLLQDIDVVVAYGDASLLAALQADPLIGTMPAVQRGSVALITDNTPLAASGTPSALSIPATIDEYLSILSAAADLVQ